MMLYVEGRQASRKSVVWRQQQLAWLQSCERSGRERWSVATEGSTNALAEKDAMFMVRVRAAR